MGSRHTYRGTRVIHVALQLDTGGMEKLLVEFARHADRKQFNLGFVSLTTRGRVAQEIEALGWPIWALHAPPGLRPSLCLRLASLFRAWGADVVHLHNTKPMLYGAPAARLGGVRRTIYTRHGQRQNASGRQNLAFMMASRLLDAAVCVSRDSAALSVRQGIDSRRIHTIWNGIDTTRFSYHGPVDRGPALMVARLNPEKDVETLLHATALVVKAESDFKLEIVGDGPCLNDLQHKARELKLSDSVSFLGNRNDVATLLERASFGVLSSLTEGISLTLLESMARGLPVVATNVGGNPEIVLDGRTGLLVPPRNPSRLAQAMLELWRNPQKSREMGWAGHRRVQMHFDARQMVCQYEQLYRGALRPAPDAEQDSADLNPISTLAGDGA